jgi:hypothetical protein
MSGRLGQQGIRKRSTDVGSIGVTTTLSKLGYRMTALMNPLLQFSGKTLTKAHEEHAKAVMQISHFVIHNTSISRFLIVRS